MGEDSNAYSAIIAFACGIILLLISFFQFVSPGITYHPVGSASLAPDNARGCETPFPSRPLVTQTTNNNSGDIVVVTNTPVLLMKPGTTARLCMSYTEISSGQTFSGKVYSQVVGATNMKNVTIAPHPENIADKDYYFANAIDALQNKRSFDVAYDINAPVNSKGFYGLWPLGVCPGLPLAVGYDATEINYSKDFPWTSGPYYGCSGFIDAKIVGLSGIEVSYITKKSESNIGYEISGVQYNITKGEIQENQSISEANPPSEAVTVTFTVHFHTYNATFNVIVDAKDFAIAHFDGNPQFEKDNGCNWVATNKTVFDHPDNRSIYDGNLAADTQYVKIAGRSEKILPYTTDSTYSFNVTLTNLPEGYYALQPAIFITDENEPLTKYGINANTSSNTNAAGSAIANYFPVTIGGKLPSAFANGNETGSPNAEEIHGQC